MPSLSLITNTFFTNLIARLGIRPPPPTGFEISNVVQPVSIVDSDISLQAISTTINLDTNFSTGGEILSPGAAALLADTGPLPAGKYAVLIWAGADTVANFIADFRVQRRDAANATSIWSQLFSFNNTGSSFFVFAATMVLALNERIRVITKDAATAGGTYQVTIWTQVLQ